MTANLKIHKVNDHICELIISNPQRRNAMTQTMWESLPDYLQSIINDNYRVLILRGDGEHFCAGADISEFDTVYASKNEARKTYRAIRQAFMSLADCSIPTIAAIKGFATGGGCGLALACDIRFVALDAKLAITPAKLGLVYPFDEIKRLSDIVGIATAKDLLFSARLVDAVEAHKIGLVTHVGTDLDADVLEYAKVITSRAPQAVCGMKTLLHQVCDGQVKDDRVSEDMFVTACFSDEFRQGMAAFKTKTNPQF